MRGRDCCARPSRRSDPVSSTDEDEKLEGWRAEDRYEAVLAKRLVHGRGRAIGDGRRRGGADP